MWMERRWAAMIMAPKEFTWLVPFSCPTAIPVAHGNPPRLRWTKLPPSFIHLCTALYSIPMIIVPGGSNRTHKQTREEEKNRWHREGEMRETDSKWSQISRLPSGYATESHSLESQLRTSHTTCICELLTSPTASRTTHHLRSSLCASLISRVFFGRASLRSSLEFLFYVGHKLPSFGHWVASIYWFPLPESVVIPVCFTSRSLLSLVSLWICVFYFSFLPLCWLRNLGPW